MRINERAVTVAAGFYSYQATQENMLAQEKNLLAANIEALTDGENAGGVACLGCPIWNVRVEIGGSWWPKITCETGGSYICDSSVKCNHKK